MQSDTLANNFIPHPGSLVIWKNSKVRDLQFISSFLNMYVYISLGQNRGKQIQKNGEK